MRLLHYAGGEAVEEGQGQRPTDGELGKLLKQISERIKDDRRRAVANLFRIADRCEALRPYLKASELKVFLIDVCGISRLHARGYAALLPVLGDKKELLVDRGVAPEVVLKLAIARHDVRDEVLRMIVSGRTVQVREFAAIKRDINNGRLRQDGVLDPRRRSALGRLAATKARQEAAQLVKDIEAFARHLLSWLELPSFHPFSEPFQQRLADDAKQAAELRNRLSALSLSDELTSSETGWIWQRALTALDAIIKGRVSSEWQWDPAEELKHFLPKSCSEIAYDEGLIADLARAAGFVINPQDTQERSVLRNSDRTVLTDDPKLAVSRELTVLELCAGGGGQAIGLHAAGFRHVGLVEWEPEACATILRNRPDWPVINADLREVDYTPFHGVDLLAGGVPCQPFGTGGLGLGREDERDMFPEAVRIIGQVRPKAIMLENVTGLFNTRHLPYRLQILETLSKLGYECEWRMIEGPQFGMAQRRRRTILIGLQRGTMHRFRWPEPLEAAPKTVGETLVDLMAANGWPHAEDWARKANRYCNTLTGGSDKKTNCDYAMPHSEGPWHALAIDPHDVALEAPSYDSRPAGHPGAAGDAHTFPQLTLRMLARLQGFPDEWSFAPPRDWKPENGLDSRNDMPTMRNQPAFRQITNAFPSPLARVLGIRIKRALTGYGSDLAQSLEQPYNVRRPKFDMRDAYREKHAG